MPKCNPNLLSDQELFSLSSSVLNASTFRLFELAYYEWYGHTTTEEEMEWLYTRYLFERNMPSWLRHYTRRICQLADETSGITKFENGVGVGLFNKNNFRGFLIQIKQRALELFRLFN